MHFSRYLCAIFLHNCMNNMKFYRTVPENYSLLRHKHKQSKLVTPKCLSTINASPSDSHHVKVFDRYQENASEFSSFNLQLLDLLTTKVLQRRPLHFILLLHKHIKKC